VKFDVSHPEILAVVEAALAEDIGPGDVTTELCVDAERLARGRFIARESMTLAGLELLPLIYESAGGNIEIDLPHESGDAAAPGETLAEVRGEARRLLTCERVALNFLQRLSGVATLAHKFAEGTAGTRCRILDTRKTTPGLRRLEKMAAAAGGAVNHRMGLYDAVLIKNNHITAAGGVRAALERALPAGRPVEIEVRTQAEIEQALAGGATRLLLDNFTPQKAAEEICFIAGRATVEISGGVTLDTVAAYAATGADFISSGAITHSARAADINFRLELI
jgi:nicotinate-nucleotide pyrophosphorylase (carboxylating)